MGSGEVGIGSLGEGYHGKVVDTREKSLEPMVVGIWDQVGETINGCSIDALSIGTRVSA